MAVVEFKQVDVIFGNDPAAALKLLDQRRGPGGDPGGNRVGARRA